MPPAQMTSAVKVRSPERSRVCELQRARLIAAATELAFERGAAGVTVSAIVGRAAISRRTFYDLFSSCEQCLLAAFQDALQRAEQRVAANGQAGGSWRQRVRAALAALLAFCEECPEAAHMLVVESLSCGPEAMRIREQALSRLVAAVEEGRREIRRGPEPAALADEALVGAAVGVVHTRLLRRAQDLRRRAGANGAGRRTGGRPDPPVGRLIELLGPLMSMIVMPYLGMAAARRELAQRPPRPGAYATIKRAQQQVSLGPRGMRLTNRTILVLSAIAELNADDQAPSNRQVASAAGAADQGQISKLLARLRRLGLIDSKTPRGRGQANQWRLTPAGQALVSSFAPL
jgi:AcrR family transcriptional regulator/DNA-binding MarR family transcriptional regulator